MSNGHWFRRVIVVLAVVSFMTGAVASGALYARFTQSNAYRAADVRIWTAVICQIEQNIVTHHKHLPAAKVRKALRFYDRLLVRDVQTDGCGLIRP